MIRMQIFLFYLLCIGMLPLAAQQPEARQVMERTAASFRQAGGVKATFTVRSSDGTSSEGSICLKGEKFRLENSDEGTTTWFDGHTQWTYVASNNEVYLSEPTAEELQSINPYALLSLYERGYSLKMKPAEATRNDYEVTLTATDRKQDLLCIILHVAKADYRPLRASMAWRGGETALVVITSYQTGQAYDDNFFAFDPKACPTAEVIDLR